ncbi:proteinase inhibitor, propeptide [Artemisia annua]|uniref:Proteinase inhibitor, propeptide n=1 Tax=Artemisia annua TaxID=35608 RepID=A0A2U1MRI4_ARTAN|nr:proteinase inhibitor, propeptide [Artemisia annua]
MLCAFKTITTSRVKSFKAIGSIGEGLELLLCKSALMVELFFARGPYLKYERDILAPGSL